jgi:hypothetical protein
MMQVAATVFTQLYRSLCDACLADELGVPVPVADRLGRRLASGGSFVREWGFCTACDEPDMVTRHVPIAPLRSVAF